jgi:hypothetical protein
MPQLILPVPETLESVSRPVALQVLRQISQQLQIPQNIQIIFPGDALAIPYIGSTLAKDTVPQRFNVEQRYRVDIEETYPEGYGLSTRFGQPDDFFFFYDKALGVYIKPSYQRVEMKLNVTYRSTSRTDADLWENRTKKKVSQGQQDHLLEIGYHYPLPASAIGLLCQIYDMRQANKPYDDDIGKWMRQCFSPKFSVISNLAGRQETFVIRENQIRILGWFDFDHSPPKFDRSVDAGAWDASFTYTFSFDKCETVVMRYPLMIHNQIMPHVFRDTTKVKEITDIIAQGSVSTEAFNRISHLGRAPATWTLPPGIPVPVDDDWLPEIEPPNTTNLMRLLLQVDPADPKALVNLNSLGEWRFDVKTRNYMKACGNNLRDLYESVFKIDLYRNKEYMNSKLIMIDDDLNLHYDEALDEREYYHLTISLMYDLALLSDAAKRLLSIHGGFTIKLLMVLDPSIAKSGRLPKLLPDGSISMLDLIAALKYLSQQRYPGGIDGRQSWYLVGHYVINANRKE